MKLAHNDFIALDVALSEEGKPPSEFRIFAKGEVRTRKGHFIFDDQAALDVTTEAGEFGNEFPLDYAHGMMSGLTLNPAESGKAAGWFKPEVRNGELWATDVTWTPDAQKYLKNREYRYISPTFEFSKEKRVTRLLNVALTNIPASHKLQPLMAHYDASQMELRVGGETICNVGDAERLFGRGAAVIGELKQLGLPTRATGAADSVQGERDEMKTVALAVGLPSEATEGDVLSKVTLYREVATEITKLTGKENPREALGMLNAWKLENEKLEEARTKVAALEAVALKREVEEKVEEKIRDGFLAPAQRDFAITLGMRDGEMLAAFLDGLKTKVVNRPEVVRAQKTSGAAHGFEMPSDDELAKLGISAESYANTAQLMLKEGSY